MSRASRATRLVVALRRIYPIGGLIVATAVVAALGAACNRPTSTLAILVPETGSAGVYGQAVRQGVELALEELELASTFDVVFVDTESDPAVARQALERAFRRDAVAAIGGITSAEALAMAPVAARAERVLLSPTASSPQLPNASDFLFRMFPSDALEASSMARFASQTLGFDEVMMIADDRAYGSGVRAAFKDAFASFLGRVVELPMGPDDAPEMVAAAATEAEPQAIFLAAYEERLVDLIRALGEAGYSGRLLTTHAFATSSAIEQVGRHAAGVLVPQTALDLDRESPVVQDFAERFRQRWATPPSLFAAYGYDAVRLLAAASGRASRTRGERATADGIVRRLPGVEVEGVTGTLAFDRRGVIERPPRVHIVGDDLRLVDYDAYLDAQRTALIERLERLRRTAGGRD